jgi:hypothetical protein
MGQAGPRRDHSTATQHDRPRCGLNHPHNGSRGNQ